MGSTIKFFVCFFRKFLDHHDQPKVPLNRKLTYVVLIVTLNSSHVNTLLYQRSSPTLFDPSATLIKMNVSRFHGKVH